MRPFLLYALCDDFNLHKKIKETTGIYRKNNLSLQWKWWNYLRRSWKKNYMGSIYKNFMDKRPCNDYRIESGLTWSVIKTEIERAIQIAKNKQLARIKFQQNNPMKKACFEMLPLKICLTKYMKQVNCPPKNNKNVRNIALSVLWVSSWSYSSKFYTKYRKVGEI